MEHTIYNKEGKEVGSITLPESVFGVRWNPDLVHQVVVSMQANARTPVAHTKDRSDVSGGGRKPWRQKGTGRARHGSRRSPIWIGGGVTFGPRNDRDFTKRINKKMRSKALYSALSKKLADGEVLFVDDLTFEHPKSADAKKALASLSSLTGFEKLLSKRTNAALIAQAERNTVTEKSFANFSNVYMTEARNLNPVDVLNHEYVIITNPDISVAQLESRMSGKKEKEVTVTAKK